MVFRNLCAWFALMWAINAVFTLGMAAEQANKPEKVVCISIPKCGTHLLLKCISLFDSSQHKVQHKTTKFKQSKREKLFFQQVNQYNPPNHFKGRLHVPTMGPLPAMITDNVNNNRSLVKYQHWPYTKEAEQFFNEKGSAHFFVMRDPRAMLVSMAHMVKDGWKGEHANVQDVILDFIDGRQKHFIRWGVTVHEAYPLIWELGVTDFYKLYLPWMHAKKFYTVRFENLIGAKGGGADMVQLQEINNIAMHLGRSLSSEEIKAVRDQLFGGSTTFREGKIDGWKKHFTPEMKTAYKKAPGANQLLIDLGYEKDDQW